MIRCYDCTAPATGNQTCPTCGVTLCGICALIWDGGQCLECIEDANAAREREEAQKAVDSMEDAR